MFNMHSHADCQDYAGSPPGIPAATTTPPGSPLPGPCSSPGTRGRYGHVAAALDWAADKLPPSPNDPPLGMDLRKTALLRSLMLRTDVSNFSC